MVIDVVMEKAVKVNKYLYKIELYLLKRIPVLISLLYLSNVILTSIGINLELFSLIGGMSVLPIIFFYVSSYAFGFCNYHRMFLHYITISEIFAWIDYKFYIVPTNKLYLTINSILFSVALFLTVYLKLKHNAKEVNNKTIKRSSN